VHRGSFSRLTGQGQRPPRAQPDRGDHPSPGHLASE
jgi:hypothetical protein